MVPARVDHRRFILAYTSFKCSISEITTPHTNGGAGADDDDACSRAADPVRPYPCSGHINPTLHLARLLHSLRPGVLARHLRQHRAQRILMLLRARERRGHGHGPRGGGGGRSTSGTRRSRTGARTVGAAPRTTACHGLPARRGHPRRGAPQGAHRAFEAEQRRRGTPPVTCVVASES